MLAELRDSLENLYADSRVSKTRQRAMGIDVARGGTAAAHVLLNEVKEGSVLQVVLRGKRGVVGRAEWFRAH